PDLGRQHRLRSLARVAADDPVDVARRARPDLLERRPVALARRHRQADLAEKRSGVEIKLVPLLPDLVRKLLDSVVEAGEGDGALRVVQVSQNAAERMDRVDGGASVNARVQIAIRAPQN